MHALPQQASPVIRLRDYQPPAWRVESIELEVELDIDASEIVARLQLRRDPAQSLPLRLDGENLQLLSIALDGRALDAEEIVRRATGEGLTERELVSYLKAKYSV